MDSNVSNWKVPGWTKMYPLSDFKQKKHFVDVKKKVLYTIRCIWTDGTHLGEQLRCSHRGELLVLFAFSFPFLLRYYKINP